MEITAETFSPDETAALGTRFAGFLKPGDVISLTGDLGAGKTKFVQGLAAGLGVADHVTSPTFAIIKEYEGLHVPLFHFDVYRLDGEKDLIDLGYEGYFFDDGVSVVEWGDKVAGLLPATSLTVDFRRRQENERLLTFSFKDIRWNGIVEGALR